MAAGIWSKRLIPSFYRARTSTLLGLPIFLAPWIQWPFCFSFPSFWPTPPKWTFQDLCVCQIMVKERQQIKLWDLYPPETLLYYLGTNVCNYFVSHVHALEQKSTQNLGSRRPMLLFICTIDYNVVWGKIYYNVAKTINNLVAKPFCALRRYAKNLQYS